MRLAGSRLDADSFVIAEWSDRGETRPDWPIAPLHVHYQDDEAWYVLEGRLGFRIGEETLEAARARPCWRPEAPGTPTGTRSRP